MACRRRAAAGFGQQVQVPSSCGQLFVRQRTSHDEQQKLHGPQADKRLRFFMGGAYRGR